MPSRRSPGVPPGSLWGVPGVLRGTPWGAPQGGAGGPPGDPTGNTQTVPRGHTRGQSGELFGGLFWGHVWGSLKYAFEPRNHWRKPLKAAPTHVVWGRPEAAPQNHLYMIHKLVPKTDHHCPPGGTRGVPGGTPGDPLDGTVYRLSVSDWASAACCLATSSSAFRRFSSS